MLILLALPVIVVVAAMHRYLQDNAPSNLLVRRMRTQQTRLRTAFALTAVAGVLLFVMDAGATAVANGAPGWLNLVVLILAWDTIKLALAALAAFLRATWAGARRVRLRVAEPGRFTP